MRRVIERPSGSRDLAWIVAVSAATAILAFFLIGYLRLRFELYESARERAHQAWLHRQLEFQREHLELERRYRARSLDWSPESPLLEGLDDLDAGQSLELEAQ